MSFTNPYPASRLTLDATNSLSSGLVGFWPLTDGTGSTAKDISTGGNDGTLSGVATWDTSSIGAVADLPSGTGNISIGTTSDFVFSDTGTMSVSFWAYFDSDNSRWAIMGTGVTSAGNDWFITREYLGGTGLNCLRYGLNYNNTPNSTLARVTPDNSATAGTWNHWVVVASGGSSLTIYKDGVSQALTALSTEDNGLNGAATANTHELQLGSSGSTLYGQCDLQNVRIYNRALSATEVATLYNRPWEGTNYGDLWPYSPPAPADATLSTDTAATSLMSGCVGWWPLTDGSGSTAVDIVGTNDATAGGTVTWETTSNGTAALFDGTGNGYFDIGTDLVGSGDYAISAWVNVDAAASGNLPIYCSVSTGTWGYQDLFYIIGTTLGYDTPPASGGISATFPTIGQGWKHVAIVASSGTWYLYGDGEILATATQETYSGTNTTNYYVGYRNSSWQFDGNIQNVRIWNRALSAEEVALLYERPFEGITYGDAFHYDPPTPANLTPLDNSSGINTDCVGWWPLTETDDYASGAADISGNGNNGTQSGGVLSEVSRLGGVASFDGFDDEIGITLDISSFTGFSVSLWAKVNSADADGRLFSIQHSGPDDIRMYHASAGHFSMDDGGTAVNVSIGDTADDTWHFYTGTFDGSTVRAYVDGVETGSASDTFNFATSSSNVRIGNQAGTVTQFSQAEIQNVRIWSRALSAAEVWSIYENPWLGSAYSDAAAVIYNYILRSKRFRRL